MTLSNDTRLTDKRRFFFFLLWESKFLPKSKLINHFCWYTEQSKQGILFLSQIFIDYSFNFQTWMASWGIEEQIMNKQLNVHCALNHNVQIIKLLAGANSYIIPLELGDWQ